MDKQKKISFGLLLLILGFFSLPFVSVQAAGPCDALTAKGEKNVPCATSPAQCASQKVTRKIGTSQAEKDVHVTPPNCLFLEEPIGGEIGYDLYKVTCTTQSIGEEDKSKTSYVDCATELWRGESLPDGVRGPIQAILTTDPSKPYQGSFGLLYSYVGIVYKFVSGLIIGIVVLFIVVGGIQIILSGGGEGYESGKSRIVKALTGMVIWFLASAILYTINPTFFTF